MDDDEGACLMDTNPVLRLLAQRESANLETLFRLLRQPSISATGEGVQACAEMCKTLLEDTGFTAEVLPGPGQPVVYGEWVGDPDAFTLLIYGHYDVQPPDPVSLWHSPPFEPDVRDGRIYARGVADNKGQFVANILALHAYLKTHGRLPVNVKVVLEGEEEQASVNLAQFVREYRDKLRCDLAYTADGPQHASGKPTINLGVRGILTLELNAQGADRDNHSGNRGNIAPNPAWNLVHLLSSMKAPDGRILIEGFYDDVEPPSDTDEQLIAALPYDPTEAGASMGLPPLEFDKESFYRRLMFEPTLNICGFGSGYQGEGSKTIIPATATVKLDIRLVLDQDPDDIFEKVRRHIAEHAPHVRVTRLGDMQPSRTSAELPVCQAVIRAVEEAYGEAPIVTPSAGGSLPDYVWTKILGVPSIIVPYGNPDQANHSPNENMRLANFEHGMQAMVQVLSRLAETSAG